MNLAPCIPPALLAQDLLLDGSAGTLVTRAELATNEAHVRDAPNPWGFAACAVTAVLGDLYTAANYQN